MPDHESYKSIRSELLAQRDGATSLRFRALIDQALQRTDGSYANLRQLEAQREILIKELHGAPPPAPEVIESAAASITALEEFEDSLREELRLSEEERAGPPPAPSSLEIPEESSPEDREFFERTQRLFQETSGPVQREPETIREEIERNRERKRLVADSALTAVTLAGSVRANGVTIFVTGNLWLSHVLLNQIYDVTETDFEKSLRHELHSEIAKTVIGQLLGILPLVGISVGLLDLVLTVKNLRRGRWKNADSAIAFLDNYTLALMAWDERFRSHCERGNKFMGVMGIPD